MLVFEVLKKIRKIIKYLGAILLFIVLFRGPLYRIIIKYNIVQNRSEITLTDKSIIEKIDSLTLNNDLNISDIIDVSNAITTNKLDFTFKKVSSNPNVIVNEGRANCIGYASLFNSITNYIIYKQGLGNKYKCAHVVGELKFLGADLHAIFNSPFFKNHDFNKILLKEENTYMYIDPSLYDYFWIESVSCE